jgi:hypothetical protein
LSIGTSRSETTTAVPIAIIVALWPQSRPPHVIFRHVKPLPYQYRLTKYDPACRDENGAFSGDDWTSMSDIGETFGGVRLTLSRYLDVEARHLQVMASFIEESNVTRLTALQVEDADALGVREGQQLSPLRAVEAVRAMLRARGWCRLAREDFYIHVGWDYYLYVGTHRPCQRTLALAAEMGLFAEGDFPSPYCDDESESADREKAPLDRT